MGDYIDRESYCKTICRCDREYCDKEKCQIWTAPVADVRPVVRGRWRWVGQDRWNDCYECSQCGKMNTDNSNFCPNCGADMREETNSE